MGALTASLEPERHEVYDEAAFIYDGSLEGLLTAVFAAFEKRQNPTDVVPENMHVPRLSQIPIHIETDIQKACRVRKWLRDRCGNRAFRWVLKASLSSDPCAGTHAYRFIRHAVDLERKLLCNSCNRNGRCAASRGGNHCPKLKGITSDISNNAVGPLFRINRTIENECEKIRQFARFQHLKGNGFDLWFARINPKDKVVPLVMDHFVERFNIQPFVLYDEISNVAGIYDGNSWFTAIPEDSSFLERLDEKTAEEAAMQEAWKRFYRSVSIDERYNPELRMGYMPKRFWGNLTEMQETLPALGVQP